MLRLKPSLGLAGGLLILALLLAACDGDDKKSSVPPLATATAVPAGFEPTATYHTVGGTPAGPSGLTSTPYLLPSEPLFQEAGSVARIDLATRLNVSIEQVIILEPDTALMVAAPLTCPEIEDEETTRYYLYLQVERFLYPYQFYVPDEDAGAVVEACDDVLVDDGVLFVPTPDRRGSVLEKVQADLRERGVNAESGEFEVVLPSTWTSETLDCPIGPDDPTPAPIWTEGYQIVYVVGGIRYEYHTDLNGEQIVFCAPPPAAESAEAFIARLQLIEDLEVTIVEDDPAVYQGLDAQGVRIELTLSAYRIGVFGFATPAEARLATGMIDDAGVSRIFVSGPVMIVQEENSIEVYSLLLGYAEEVRTPILERQAEEAPVEGESEETGE